MRIRLRVREGARPEERVVIRVAVNARASPSEGVSVDSASPSESAASPARASDEHVPAAAADEVIRHAAAESSSARGRSNGAAAADAHGTRASESDAPPASAPDGSAAL